MHRLILPLHAEGGQVEQAGLMLDKDEEQLARMFSWGFDKSETVNITIKFAWILLQYLLGGRFHCTTFFFYNNKDTAACFT